MPCQCVYIDSLVDFYGSQVYVEYCFALVEVGQVDVYLSVESSGSQQCLVEYVGAVGCSQYYDSAVGAESVHLGEQLVECVFALVVSACVHSVGTCTSYCVDFVDEDDAWRLLFGLLEEVAHSAGTHSDEHLDEVATRHREEWHFGFACHGFCQQGLTCSWRPDEECTLWYLSAQLGVFGRILEEVDYFVHLALGFCLSCYVLECDSVFGRILFEEFGLRLSEAEYASAHASASHAVHDEEPEDDEYDYRCGLQQYVPQQVVVVLVG